MLALGLDASEGLARGVLVDEDGAVVRRGDGAGTPEGLQAVARELSAGRQPGAAGIAIGGGGRVPDLRGVHGLVRCTVGSAAVVAESWVGAARGARHAACFLIGESVAAGLLLHGVPWEGAHGMAGAAAWFALNPVERQDYRKFGNLAAEVSSAGIAHRLAWRIQSGDESAVLERAGSLEAIAASHVFEGARSGDGVAISVVRDTARYLGMAVANLVCCVDPEIVVLAGSIAEAGDLLIEPIRQECVRRLPPALGERLRVEISTLGVDGVAIGAARLAMLSTASTRP